MKTAIGRVLRDPLFHFLVLGAMLVFAYSAFAGGRDEGRIVVSKPNLMTFIQYRSKIFDPHIAEARLDAMSPEELKQVVDDYVAEEALYREAEALGLDKQDYIIKRRMVQKVEFIASGFDEEDTPVDEAKLKAYFRENADRFSEPGSFTFTHVFIPTGPDPIAAQSSAEALKKQLTAKRAGFTDAPRYGERYPYGVNFVEATADQLEGQFGEGFVKQLNALKVRDGVWQGPITSGLGAHVVMLVAKGETRTPDFDTVRPEVEAEYKRLAAEEQAEKSVKQIVARYPVEMKFDDPRLKAK